MKRQESVRREEPSSEVIDGFVRGAQSDPAAFGRLYQIYYDQIYSYIFHRVDGITQDAEDLTAKIFLKALKQINTYKKREGVDFKSWLLTIAHNAGCNFNRNELRRRRGVIFLDQPLVNKEANKRTGWFWEAIADTTSLSPEQVVIDSQRRSEAVTEVTGRTDQAGLSDKDRELLYLKYTLGLSNKGIGDIIGRTVTGVKTYHSRILAKLREANR